MISRHIKLGAVVLLIAVGGLCVPSAQPSRPIAGASTTTSTTVSNPPAIYPETAATTTIPLGPIPAAVAGKATVISHGPTDVSNIALTFDDGFCDPCINNIITALETSTAHITLCPNGVYGPTSWDHYAARIRHLITTGQVAICNHTWDHADLTKLGKTQVIQELVQNEMWIERTFGVTSRPYFRPPYGFHNHTVDSVAASLGWTKTVLWNGTFGDSLLHPIPFLLINSTCMRSPE